jgi:glycyl-tRNA synthetase beta chain
VLAAEADDPLDVLARAEALQSLRGETSLERLVVGFKRAANILKGIDEAQLPDPSRLAWDAAMPAEQALWRGVVESREALAALRREKNYPEMLRRLLALRQPIDRFFEDVLVMAPDPDERNRRLALLAAARALFHRFFDPARIVIEGETGS